MHGNDAVLVHCKAWKEKERKKSYIPQSLLILQQLTYFNLLVDYKNGRTFSKLYWYTVNSFWLHKNNGVPIE